MDLNVEVWNEINSTPGMTDEVKKTLLVRVMRKIEESNATPAHKKLGVTIMTQESSLAGDKVASDRKAKPMPGDARPKTL